MWCFDAYTYCTMFKIGYVPCICGKNTQNPFFQPFEVNRTLLLSTVVLLHRGSKTSTPCSWLWLITGASTITHPTPLALHQVPTILLSTFTRLTFLMSQDERDNGASSFAWSFTRGPVPSSWEESSLKWLKVIPLWICCVTWVQVATEGRHWYLPGVTVTGRCELSDLGPGNRAVSPAHCLVVWKETIHLTQ